MKIKLILLIFLLLLTNSAQAAIAKFAQVTDVHYSLNTDEARSYNYANTARHLQRTISKINRDNSINFVIFTGDCIESSDEKELRAFMSDLSKLNKMYYIALGNHDVHKVSGLSKDKFMEIVSEYDKRFTDLDTNYSFKINKNLTGVVLDGASPMLESSHGYFSEKTLNWLDNILAKNETKKKKVVIFQHFPVIEPVEDETHSILEKEKYLAVLSKHKNVVAILSGHYHANGEFLDVNGTRHYSTDSLTKMPITYRTVEINTNIKSNKTAPVVTNLNFIK